MVMQSTEQALNETVAKKNPGGTFLQIQTDLTDLKAL